MILGMSHLTSVTDARENSHLNTWNINYSFNFSFFSERNSLAADALKISKARHFFFSPPIFVIQIEEQSE